MDVEQFELLRVMFLWFLGMERDADQLLSRRDEEGEQFCPGPMLTLAESFIIVIPSNTWIPFLSIIYILLMNFSFFSQGTPLLNQCPSDDHTRMT